MQLRRELLELRVGLDEERVERLGEETACGGGEHDVHDLRVREAEVAKALEVGLGDRRRVVDDALGEVHDGEIDRVEGRFPVVDDRDDVFAHLIAKDVAVHDRAVRGPKPLRGGEGRELVAAQLHVLEDGADEARATRRRRRGAPRRHVRSS